MSGGPGHRLPSGGAVDRTRPLRFAFNGAALTGFAGDTLASALLANGVSTVGRSFKYHRRRGLFAAGADEPNAIVQLGEGARTVPNPKATQIPLYAGLAARSVNCWPGPELDLGALAGALGRFLPAGFYYKTFMWPGWRLWEPLIRRAAGLGTAPRERDPDRYEKRRVHCDVLVVGGGPAGLAAALAAGRSGARVILADEQPALGGALLFEDETLGDAPATDWAAAAEAELAALPEVAILRRTAVFGYYDHNGLAAIEQLALPGAASADGTPAQRLWKIRAGEVVLATGAIERPIVFGDNDKPGVMLAGAARHYLRRYAAAAGTRLVLFATNDDAYRTALAFAEAGLAVAAIVDPRETPRGALPERARAAGIAVLGSHVVLRAIGRRRVTGAEIAWLDGSNRRRLDCDLIAVSGGWNPSVHLFSQSGGTLRFDPALAAFVPAKSVQRERSAGACAGILGLGAVLASGADAGEAAAGAAKFGGPAFLSPPPPAGEGREGEIAGQATTLAHLQEASPSQPSPAGGGGERMTHGGGERITQPLWQVPATPGVKSWVDLMSDVTADDVALAARENYASVEHLKRYTTTGMSPDQGKTSNVNALALLAAATGRAIPEVGTTRFRPPWDPVTLGALAGRELGDFYRPRLRLPLHDRHVAAGAAMEEYGGWERPAAYPRPGESLEAAIRREAAQVRDGVGIFDGSPLGKIEVAGPDAAVFLDRIYVGTVSTLPVGGVRYGLMLNENGIVSDDGVASRLAPERFLVGTTSGGASRIAGVLEEWLQCEWPDLRVFATPVTQQWGVVTLSGPRARALLKAVGTDIDLAPASFRHMSAREGDVAGIPSRVFRVSFTGEVTYEINVPWGAAPDLWARLMAAGREVGLAPFGIEALMILRIEKGYVHVGSETDGTTVPDDIGMGGAIARKASDFVGRRSLMRPEARRSGRHQLVGLLAEAPATVLAAGTHVVAEHGSDGWVTSSCFSPTLGRGIALAMLRDGRRRHGELVELFDHGTYRRGRIVAPCFFDPSGARLHG